MIALAARLALVFSLTICLLRSAELKKMPDRKPAAGFALKDEKGRVVQLSEFEGKVLLIDFWATWCGPCRAETPWLVRLSDQYKEQGLVILGVSMDDGWPAIQPFVAKTGMTYPVVLGDQSLTAGYGDLDALPVAYFVDRRQRVAAIHIGAGSKKQFEENIKGLLNE